MRTTAFYVILAALLVFASVPAVLANGVTTPRSAVPASPGAGPAVVPPATPPATPPAPVAPTAEPVREWNRCDLATMTVSEAWELSGRDYAVFSDMIRSLVNLSADRRGVSLPDTNDAGREIGCMIRQRAEADPNQLLYVVVDSSVRDYAISHNLIQR